MAEVVHTGGSNPTGGEYTETITGRILQGAKFLTLGDGGAGMFSALEYVMKGAVWLAHTPSRATSHITLTHHHRANICAAYRFSWIATKNQFHTTFVRAKSKPQGLYSMTSMTMVIKCYDLGL